MVIIVYLKIQKILYIISRVYIAYDNYDSSFFLTLDIIMINFLK